MWLNRSECNNNKHTKIANSVLKSGDVLRYRYHFSDWSYFQWVQIYIELRFSHEWIWLKCDVFVSKNVFVMQRCKKNDYNMTVWILAGNYISFTIAAGLIRLHMPGVKKSCVKLGRARVTILSMVITGTIYWKSQQSLVSQATLQPSIMFADSL